jgi:S-adenosylmethionine decarboxylase
MTSPLLNLSAVSADNQPTVNYQPGKHIIFEANGCSGLKCCQAADFDRLIQDAIRDLDLNLLGEIVYSFPNGAFTATYCLTESHIAVHTWPEFARVTFDVFLSNYMHANDEKAEALSRLIIAFFETTDIHTTVLMR